MRGDEDHDDANKIDLDVTEISNHTIVREVAQTRNFIVPGYQRFRPTEGYNVLDLEGDFGVIQVLNMELNWRLMEITKF